MKRILLTLALAGATGLLPFTFGAASRVQAAPPAPHSVPGHVPDVVAHGKAGLKGHHDANDTLSINVGLTVRNSGQLDALIAAANDPKSPQYHHYLTNAQYLAQYAPTSDDVQAVRDWASQNHLSVTSASPDNLIVSLQGKTHEIEKALGVTINDYSDGNRSFRSADRDPTIPGDLHVNEISGLETYYEAHTSISHASLVRPYGYYPQDFLKAYDVNAVGDGTNQTIGFTLWGAPVTQNNFDSFAAATGTPDIVIGQAGANGLDYVFPNGQGTLDVTSETAMDLEYAHGVAPNSHMRYFLGHSNDIFSVEDAVNAAANDPSLKVVSNSWGFGGDFKDTNPNSLDTSLQHAASIGETFFFSTGDGGSNSGGASTTAYPSSSPYIVAVGGTTLNTDATGNYLSETGWDLSGGGCSKVWFQPAWQTGVPAKTCPGRGEPDVSADADPNTGADVYWDGTHGEWGGTSLATPLWAGMTADINEREATMGLPGVGFFAPLIYQAANDGVAYPQDFHDVTIGSNGAYHAGTRWDEVTGWGSPDLNNLFLSLTTLPQITPNVTGTLGNNGWYRSDVSVSWNVSSPYSSITAQSGCSSQSVTTDTTGVTFTCMATNLAGTNSNSVTIMRDTAAPTCTFLGVSNGTLSVQTQDVTSGLAAPPDGITYTVSNATVALPPYYAGDTNAEITKATKTISGQSSSIVINFTDMAGNSRQCDPVMTNAIRSAGKPESMSVSGIGKADHLVHVANDTPGVGELTVTVNGQDFKLHGMKDGQTASLDIASALKDGANSVTITTTGKPGGSAALLFGDM